MTIIVDGTTGISGVDGSSATPAIKGNDSNTGISYGTDTVTINTGGVARVTTDSTGNLSIADDKRFCFGGVNNGWSGNTAGNIMYAITNSAERMRIDPSGNVGIGTSSPVGKLDIISGTARMYFSNQSSTAFLTAVNTANSAYALLAINGSELILKTGDAERARIDASGNLLVGATSGNGKLSVLGTAGVYSISVVAPSTSGTYYYTEFRAGGTQTGYILSTDGTTTAYSTTSDYRLKENVAPMTGALAKVAQLKPCTYTWKSTGEAGQGFIAHELQEVVPDCVTGEKDAVDVDGNPQYQGVDTSFLVATLTAAIQEQQAMITELTARLEALENK